MPPKKKPTSITSSPSPQQTQFHISDKVFAQSKDFPIWPAKIIKLHPKSKSPGAKVKVYFYGRRETGNVTLSDLYDYQSSKSQFADDPPSSKVLSKLFKLALEEIENDDGQDVSTVDHSTIGPKKRGRKKKYPESGDEGIGILMEEEEDDRNNMSAYDTADEQVHPVPKKRGRKPKKKLEKRENTEPKDSSYSQDEDSIQDHAHAADTQSLSSPSSHRSPLLEPSDLTLNQHLSPPGEELEGHHRQDILNATGALAGAQTPYRDHEMDSLPLLEDGLIPLDHLERLPDYLQPRDMMAIQLKVQEFDTMKRSIEKGGALPFEYDTPYSSGISGWSHSQSEIINQIKYNNLRIECKMMALEKLIKESLTLDRLNFPRAMSRIDAVMALDMTPHMLIRNPEFIFTFQRLQRFSVHPDINNISLEYDLTLAKIQAALIRFKAERVMEKIESLFEIPPGKTFLEVYCAATLGHT